jgi:hypothetical protein
LYNLPPTFWISGDASLRPVQRTLQEPYPSERYFMSLRKLMGGPERGEMKKSFMAGSPAVG